MNSDFENIVFGLFFLIVVSDVNVQCLSCSAQASTR